ncbi:MAG: nuclear transport factor 2 (NTF2) superfamily protein [Patiriisocius sp.]|jgi:nuclear transport factor 2 (NTF2) superfamily protein
MEHRHLIFPFTQAPALQKTQAIEGACNTRNQLKIAETHTKQTISNRGVQK